MATTIPRNLLISGTLSSSVKRRIPPLHLLWRDALDLRAQQPLIAERVAHCPGPLSVKLIHKLADHRGSGIRRLLHQCITVSFIDGDVTRDRPRPAGNPSASPRKMPGTHDSDATGRKSRHR